LRWQISRGQLQVWQLGLNGLMYVIYLTIALR
jgi:hypothetical protein